MRIAVVAVRQSDGVSGGAERFYDGLVGAFRALGHRADELTLYADEADYTGVMRSYVDAYDLDVSAYDLVISTKAPTWMVRHPNHVCYMVHTMRVFYDMFDDVFPGAGQEFLAKRQRIHDLDSGTLQAPRCKAVFSIGAEVSARLRAFNEIDAPVLHPPLWTDAFREGSQGDYFFLPGRLHAWKRVDLVIQAFRSLEAPLRLVIAGAGDAEASLRSLADGDPRIEFLGRVDDDRLVELYANALAVPFAPKREDYGYVTLEAFASGKPVITCDDSGEAAAIVAETGGGVVVSADYREIAGAMQKIHLERTRARDMGALGAAWVKGLSWENIARRLVEAGECKERHQ